jgi:dihydrofolate reductase
MRKLIVKMSISIDGFVSDINDGKDWVFKTGDEESAAWSVGAIKQAGLIIMGRKTFESLSNYWPTATGPFAEPMNETPKATFTQKGFKGIGHKALAGQSAAAASWAEAQIINGDLAEEIRKLKAESGKPIVAIGGAGFMRSLIATGLVDEYHLGVHPVALGSGLSIFSDIKMPLYLNLKDVKAFPKGVTAKTYTV